ncbi:SDR family oxidoreductase [Novilysobacter selenitireducens]|uniref:SDR family oxidoreductase n=1 Tax=Novilysobacter selenitireducens TaxID=2872639 RepID=A0ABS7T569_9GAMM|nr:SDR family oxidoreductase [Lysobacter selenitireducens]MBZ4039010.1 SDR family oxidoreductase [Lysobacter selenitireducens]
MDLDLSGKHALVCGASEGIGRAAAHELALLGASVTVLARRAEALQAVVDALPARNGQRHGRITADVSQTNALADKVGALAGERRIDILVNNTGGPPGGPVASATADAFLQAFTRHLLANQALAQAVLPGMQAAGWGRIVNVVSTSVREPIQGLGVSNTTRGAVAAWAKTLSREVASQGITVNNVLPGFTETGRIAQIVGDRARNTGKSEQQVADGMKATVPAARFARPEEVAAAIAFLCSPAAGYINGVSLAVDGGRMQSI